MKLIISSFKRSGFSTFIVFVGFICALLALAKAQTNKPQFTAPFVPNAPAPKVDVPTPNYTVTSSTGASIVSGTTDIGNHCDDCVTAITLPFPVILYDQVFTTANASSNGNLQFGSGSGAYANACLPDDGGSVFTYTIFPYWDDLEDGDTADGQGIFTSVSGTAPNRIFNIEWRTQHCCGNGAPTLKFEIRLYEGLRKFDIIYGSPLDNGDNSGNSYDGSGGTQTVGVQAEYNGTHYTEYECDTAGTLSPGLKLTFEIPQSCAPAPAGMISWWKGEGDATDSQDDNNGTLKNNAGFAPAEVGQGFSLNGVDQYVEIPVSTNLEITGAISVDAWIKPEDFSGYPQIIAKYNNDDTNQRSWSMGIQPTGQIAWGVQNGSTYRYVDTPNPISTGVWTHVAGTFDPTTQEVKIYVNGIDTLASLEAGSGIVNTIAVGPDTPVEIGSFFNNPGGQYFFKGAIDEVEIFDRALSSTEVASMYIAGSVGKCPCAAPPDGMVSWWRAENDYVDTADGNHGSQNGSVPFAPGEVGQAFSFDGNTANYVFVPHNANLDLTAFTVDAWVYPNGDSPDGGMTVIDKEFTFGGINYALFVGNDGTVEIDFNGAGHQFVDSAPGAAPKNTWTHIAGTYDGPNASKTLTLYINGAPVGAFTSGGGKETPATGQDVVIGVRNAASLANPFVGFIDEVEVFDHALTDSEVFAIYQAGGAGKCRSCTAAPAGMIHWYPGNDDTKDVEGENNGTWHGNATFAPGKVADAFSFDGSSYIDVGSIDLPATFTIDAWINPSSINNNPIVIANLDNENNGYFLQLENDGSLFAFVLSAAVTTYQSVPAITTGGWHHIAVTYNGSAGNGDKFIFYVDGAVVPIAHANTEAGGAPNHSSASALIGSYQANSNFFSGLIDEFELYDRVLSQNEIRKIFDAGSKGKCPCVTPPDNLVSWWTADDNYFDVQGGNIGTPINGVTFVSGEVSDAFHFNGANQFVQTSNAANLRFERTNAFSIDAWVRTSETVHNMFVASKQPNSAPFSGYGLAISNGEVPACDANNATASGAGQLLGFLVTSPSGGCPPDYNLQVRGTTQLNDGQWHHVAMTYDGSGVASGLTLYVDGKTETGVVQQDNLGSNSILSNAPFTIGSRESGGVPFNGDIDEVEVFSSVLTATEIGDIYYAAGAGKCKPRTHVITVSASPSNEGTVSGGGTYQNGSEATVVATPNNCYQFVNWTENNVEVSTSASYSFIVTVDRDLVAHFTKSDNSAPIVTTPENLVVRAQKKKVNGQKGAYVFFSVSATDQDDGNVPAQADPPSGSFFPVGTTIVNVTSTDDCNNTGNNSFTITVKNKK